MEVNYELLFDRIKADPIAHLGSFSPSVIYPYFEGYKLARRKHGFGEISGRMSLFQFGRWFSDKVSSGSHNCSSICLLKTDTEEEALALFFEFHRIAIKEFTESQAEEPGQQTTDEVKALAEWILHDSMRTRPVLYFGNTDWLRSMWALCSGYIWAEIDLGINGSEDQNIFTNFQTWLDKRYSFAEGANWGKLFTFLGMDSNQKAYGKFYDDFELFLEGGTPDSSTKRMQEWIEESIAAIKEQQKKCEL